MKLPRLNEPKALVIAAIITGLLGLIGVLTAPKQEAPIIMSLPEPVPTLTHLPTVIGTPMMYGGISVKGPIGFQLVANNIIFVVDEIHAYKDATNNPISIQPGYVFIVAKIRIANGSSYLISGYNFWLIDDNDNKYVYQPIADFFNLPNFDRAYNSESGSGALVFRVPVAAVANKLRLRLEPDLSPIKENETRFEVYFDTLAIE